VSEKIKELSPHSRKVLELLSKSARPLSAYDILDRLRRHGIKAPPTVYRALDVLVARGLVHRLESLNAFVACHGENHSHHHEHGAHFAICRACGTVAEIDDPRLIDAVHNAGRTIKFLIEHETLELTGLCGSCDGRKSGAEA
jgi:Fur family zinc uptake transcriptional regulator